MTHPGSLGSLAARSWLCIAKVTGMGLRDLFGAKAKTTADLIEGSGLELEDIGARELKGLPGARRVFRLVVPADPA